MANTKASLKISSIEFWPGYQGGLKGDIINLSPLILMGL